MTDFLTHTVPLAFGMPGPMEWMIIAGIGLLLFGNRLPDVGKGLARSIVEFRKGLKGLQDDVDGAVNTSEPAAKKPEA